MAIRFPFAAGGMVMEFALTLRTAGPAMKSMATRLAALRRCGRKRRSKPWRGRCRAYRSKNVAL